MQPFENAPKADDAAEQLRRYADADQKTPFDLPGCHARAGGKVIQKDSSARFEDGLHMVLYQRIEVEAAPRLKSQECRQAFDALLVGMGLGDPALQRRRPAANRIERQTPIDEFVHRQTEKFEQPKGMKPGRHHADASRGTQ